MIESCFSHYKITVDEDLINLISDHFDKTKTKQKAHELIIDNNNLNLAAPGLPITTQFKNTKIRIANNIYPEAAVSDPLGDLKLYKLWRNGIRYFSYPGQYKRFDIKTQKSKDASKTSIGVVGEIFAGIYANAYISPIIVNRSINKWPDFILYNGSKSFSFVESKASIECKNLISGTTINKQCFFEVLPSALKEIASDAHTKVYLCFTLIRELDPLKVDVNLVELAPSLTFLGQRKKTLNKIARSTIINHAFNKTLNALFEDVTTAKVFRKNNNKTDRQFLVDNNFELIQETINTMYREFNFDNDLIEEYNDDILKELIILIKTTDIIDEKETNMSICKFQTNNIFMKLEDLDDGKKIYYAQSTPTLKGFKQFDYKSIGSEKTFKGHDIFEFGNSVMCVSDNDLQGSEYSV